MTKLLPPSFDRFPLDNPSFSSIRKEGQIYVDKTDKIVELINSGRYLLLARPSRFGKTLLISTIATIFEEGSSALIGLKAENCWDKEKYHVVRLDFSAVRNWSDRESLYKSFDSYLKTAISIAGFESDPVPTDPALRWMKFLSSQPDSSVVILIDEYDAPLTAHLDQQEKFQIALDLIGSFFDMSKMWAGKIRFLFVAGIMKFRQTSLFSTFNNIVDVSLQPRFGTLLGYTKEEIDEYLGPYIDYAADLLDMSYEELSLKMKEMYDGFSFDQKAQTHVYAPWSVMRFLMNPEGSLQNFRLKDADSFDNLLNYLKNNHLFELEDYEQGQVIDLRKFAAADHIGGLDANVLLAHSGLLTIKASFGSKVTLGYPNNEMRETMAQFCKARF